MGPLWSYQKMELRYFFLIKRNAAHGFSVVNSVFLCFTERVMICHRNNESTCIMIMHDGIHITQIYNNTYIKYEEDSDQILCCYKEYQWISSKATDMLQILAEKKNKKKTHQILSFGTVSPFFHISVISCHSWIKK